MPNFTLLCQFNGGCMGCCGYGFSNPKEIKQAIRKNTLEFQDFNPKTKKDLIKFRDRALPMDLRKGVCRNLIEKNSRLLCPLHPQQNQGQDLRKGHCDVDYFCSTVKEFLTWPKQKQKKFLEFIKNKKLDNIEYSLQIDKGLLLKEFKSLQ